MAISILDVGNLADLIPIEQVPRLLPGNPHISTIHRWRTRGVRGVRLSSVRLGGRRLVPREALVEFIKSITSVVDGGKVTTGDHASRRRTIEAAETEVDARFVAPSRRVTCAPKPGCRKSPNAVVGSAKSGRAQQ